MRKIGITLLAAVIFGGGLFNSAGATSSYADLPVSTVAGSHYIYRFWSPVYQRHHYTIDQTEGMKMVNQDPSWNFEKIAYSVFDSQAEGTVPVYHFSSPVFQGNFYTASLEEWRRLKDTDANWNYESIAYYVYPVEYAGLSRPVYRFWSPVFQHHFFTIDEEEMQWVRDTDQNWNYEGIVFRVPLDDTNQTSLGEENILVESPGVAAIRVDEAVDVSGDYVDQFQAGNKLIAVKVYLGNLNDQPLNFYFKDFSLKDQNTGLGYSTKLIKQPMLGFARLDAGASVTGFLTYEIPENANNLRLEFSLADMQLKNNKIAVNIDVTPMVVVISHGVVDDQLSGKEIAGLVKNNTRNPVGNVKITAEFYSADNKVIGTDITYAEGINSTGLQPGEMVEFNIPYNTDLFVEYYKLSLKWQAEPKELPVDYLLEVPFVMQAPLGNWLDNESCEETVVLLSHYYYTGETLSKEQADIEIKAMIAWEVVNFGEERDIFTDEIKQMADEFYGYDSRIIEGTREKIQSEIVAGNPVIALTTAAYLKPEKNDYQETGFHTILLVGYDQTGYITHDVGTRTGEDTHYSYGVVEQATADYSHKMVVIK